MNRLFLLLAVAITLLSSIIFGGSVLNLWEHKSASTISMAILLVYSFIYSWEAAVLVGDKLAIKWFANVEHRDFMTISKDVSPRNVRWTYCYDEEMHVTPWAGLLLLVRFTFIAPSIYITALFITAL